MSDVKRISATIKAMRSRASRLRSAIHQNERRVTSDHAVSSRAARNRRPAMMRSGMYPRLPNK